MSQADTKELITLRVSLARIAQTIWVDNELGIEGRPYEELMVLAIANDRAWNDLAARVQEQARHMQYEIDNQGVNTP